MRYILSERYRLWGWYKLPAGLFDNARKTPAFLEREDYLVLLRCDGAHDFDQPTPRERETLKALEDDGVIRPARFWELLRPEQEYRSYPARYRQEAHWSVTGACNLKCRHCFMSAPHAKHGSPSHEEILGVVDQLAECGVCQVGITGGEPLIREDFLDIVDALLERDIAISTIYTNGWLVDERLLERLESRSIRPNFQLSYDGVGCHDFLRGVPGAEERALGALRLLGGVRRGPGRRGGGQGPGRGGAGDRARRDGRRGRGPVQIQEGQHSEGERRRRRRMPQGGRRRG